jgi:hypothetical protein
LNTRKEKFIIFGIIFALCIGIVVGCETQVPSTPTQNASNQTTINENINNTNENTLNNTNENTLNNTNTNTNNQTQNQEQTQNTTIILDNQINNTNNQSNVMDVVFNPIINMFNYFNITNTANPVFTNNPVITIESKNGQKLDIALEQSTVQYDDNGNIVSKGGEFPSTLCIGAVTPYGTVVGVKDSTNETVGMETTGGNIGLLIVGIILGIVGVAILAKSGILARIGR